MAFKKPPEIAQSGIETGATKAKLSWDKALVASFLAGAYIAFGGLVATTTTSGMDPKVWGALFVAYFLAVKTGVVTTDAVVTERLGKIASAKGVKESELQIFLRAVGC